MIHGLRITDFRCHRQAELRNRYRVAQEPAALHLRRQDVAGQAHIQTADELDQLLTRVRGAVLAVLESDMVVLIE